MSTNILFVFEGGRAENQIVTNLQKFFINRNTIIKCVYCAEIYQVYKEIVEDEDLDTFNLIKERNQQNKDILNDFNRNDFAEIYMFFDYDGHSTLADDNKLKQLLDFFDEETDKGKLYISYPMAESLKHISNYESFKDLNVKCKENIHYKNIVSKECLKELCQFSKYQIEIWKQLIKAHLRKMNFIVTGLFEFPVETISQLIIFSNQLEKYIENDCPTVGVLSAFPVFIHDYYGNKKTKELIS